MEEQERYVSPRRHPEDLGLELGLRPRSLQEFVGQDELKRTLGIAITAARGRGEALDHILLHGHPGLGKTTLAHIIAQELDAGLKTTSGPVIERPGDLAALLTNQKAGDVLFIDEIHRLPHVVEEVLYPAMEDYKLDLIIGQGPGARAIRLDIPRFTLVGATTRAGLLTPALRDRFGLMLRVEFYHPDHLQAIVTRSAAALQIDIDPAGAREIARRSRGTPRIANRLLKRVRDFAQVHGDGRITRARRRRGPESAGRGPPGLRPHGPPDSAHHHRKIRRRPGGGGYPGCGPVRRTGHPGGRLRTLPHPMRLPEPHPPGPGRHPPGRGIF